MIVLCIGTGKKLEDADVMLSASIDMQWKEVDDVPRR